MNRLCRKYQNIRDYNSFQYYIVFFKFIKNHRESHGQVPLNRRNDIIYKM